MAAAFTHGPVALMTGETGGVPAASGRQVLTYSQVASSETPLPVGFQPLSLLGNMTGTTLVGERLVGGRASEAERLVVGALRHVQAIASLLPIDREDERLIDDLMAKRASKLSTRPLRRREGEPR
jgi:hypothetical protein